MKAAGIIGQTLAERANKIGLSSVQWKRPGRYHGKIKAFIDAVRDGGIATLKANPPGTIPGPEHQRKTLEESLTFQEEMKKTAQESTN